MARPLRLEFPGATYHITSRGDRREPIYRDDTDRSAHLQVIGAAMDRFEANVLAYCLMGNHYHLVVVDLGSGLAFCLPHPRLGLPDLGTTRATGQVLPFAPYGRVWGQVSRMGSDLALGMRTP